METTKELLARAKKATGCKTDYEFAKRHEFSRQVVSRWSLGQVSFDDDHAEKIAGLLGEEPGYVMACAHAERAKSPAAKGNWARIAALVLAAAAAPSAHSMDLYTSGSTSHNSAKGIDIMSSRRRRLSVALASIFGPSSLHLAI